jgi:hypothetical protein
LERGRNANRRERPEASQSKQWSPAQSRLRAALNLRSHPVSHWSGSRSRRHFFLHPRRQSRRGPAALLAGARSPAVSCLSYRILAVATLRLADFVVPFEDSNLVICVIFRVGLAVRIQALSLSSSPLRTPSDDPSLCRQKRAYTTQKPTSTIVHRLPTDRKTTV